MQDSAHQISHLTLEELKFEKHALCQKASRVDCYLVDHLIIIAEVRNNGSIYGSRNEKWFLTF